jgi:hypothetical protein
VLGGHTRAVVKGERKIMAMNTGSRNPYRVPSHPRTADERGAPDPPDRTDAWMAYIDTEVAAVCADKGWGRQIRRKWAVREKPVEQSLLDDYEWKLMTNGQPSPPAPPDRLPAALDGNEFQEGTYFVLGFDITHGRFVLQHDTDHCGDMGDHRLCTTFTEIKLPILADDAGFASASYPDRLPPAGWLGRLLATLTARFRPNHFSVT